ncbi:hypothetical protein HKD37_15G043250 [Glycine soja]
MNKPPMFKGANYDYLKERNIVFFEYTHIDMWDFKDQKCNFTSKESSSKALAISDASEEEFDDDDFDEEDDELSLITRKIRKMWEKKNSSWSNESSNISFHDKEKSLIICYECKKPGHFRSECPDLEKPKG